jgi:hypothetical protein
VRRVMQSSGGQPAASPGLEAGSPEGSAEAAEVAGLPDGLDTGDQPFIDEPTQVLEVQEDGNPDKLAGILRDMRQAADTEEGTVIDGRRVDLTPAFATPDAGTPVVPSGGDEAAAVAWTGGRQETVIEADAAAATRVQGVPAGALADVSSAEISRGLDEGHAGIIETTVAAQPAVVPFEEFSSEAPSLAQMTPSGWHPAGDLDGPTETDHRPLSDEEMAGLPEGVRPGRRPQQRMGRLSRGLLVLVAAVVFGAGLAAAVRFVAGKPPATVNDGYHPRRPPGR